MLETSESDKFRISSIPHELDDQNRLYLDLCLLFLSLSLHIILSFQYIPRLNMTDSASYVKPELDLNDTLFRHLGHSGLRVPVFSLRG